MKNNTDNQTPSSARTVKANDLKPGRFYDCFIDGEHGPDKFNFAQLAIDPKSKRRYILVDASKELLNVPDLVHELIKMTFQEIDSAGFDDDPSFRFRRKVWPCILDDQGSLRVESYDWHLDNFIETDINK